jgi:protein-tyrosine-phosphatase
MAEELFNHFARSAHSRWRADSRALNQSFKDSKNPGPMSADAIRLLTGDGIRVINGERYPASASEKDFQESDLIIAMSKVEHEPRIMKDWSRYSQRVQYWDVEDLHLEKPEAAYEKVKNHVRKLFELVEKDGIHSAR